MASPVALFFSPFVTFVAFCSNTSSIHHTFLKHAHIGDILAVTGLHPALETEMLWRGRRIRLISDSLKNRESGE